MKKVIDLVGYRLLLDWKILKIIKSNYPELPFLNQIYLAENKFKFMAEKILLENPRPASVEEIKQAWNSKIESLKEDYSNLRN